MEEYEKKQAEYRKLQLERIANLPDQQFRIFVSGERFQCSYCHIPLNFEAFCPNRHCEAQTAISTEPLMMRIIKDTKFIDYQNAQIIRIGAREGKDVIKNEIGIEIEMEENDQTQQQSADIFSKLKLRKDQIPIRPLIEGRLE
jgi:hypothetical protein